MECPRAPRHGGTEGEPKRAGGRHNKKPLPYPSIAPNPTPPNTQSQAADAPGKGPASGAAGGPAPVAAAAAAPARPPASAARPASAAAAAAAAAGVAASVLGKPTADVRDVYDIGKVLGKGQFGTTRLATHKETGEGLWPRD